MQAPRRRRAEKRGNPSPSNASVSTPTLLNEAYTRLRASAHAYENACSKRKLEPIHTWMRSFGRRLDSMADVLQDEGARMRKSANDSAAELLKDENCESPNALLAVAEENQIALTIAYESITERLDMDAELYDLITQQYEELAEALEDMRDLRGEYEAFFGAAA